jgi:MoxR-like ATPase
MTSQANARYPKSVGDLTTQLRDGNYLADRGLSTAMYVALTLGRPILLEGEVGVGKTEIAKVLASTFGRQLVRLQCYEGIDTNQALYEWDYARQMLQIRALSENQLSTDDAVDRLFDFQITIPEIGTIKATTKPLVILTSNRTRELHDALKRRCLYHWIGYPTAQRELEIVMLRAPGVAEILARKVVAAVHRLRELELAKPPGVAETLDWVASLNVLGASTLDSQSAQDTLGSIIKDRDDLELVRDSLDSIIANA